MIAMAAPSSLSWCRHYSSYIANELPRLRPRVWMPFWTAVMMSMNACLKVNVLMYAAIGWASRLSEARLNDWVNRLSEVRLNDIVL